MDPLLTQLILKDRQVAYAITDRALNVIEVGGATGMLMGGGPSWVGRSLLQQVPELVGSEAALQDVLNGKLPRFHLEWVNRGASASDTLYLTLVNLPHRDPAGQITGLLHLAQDVTEMGVFEQRVTHQRNQLRLLQEALARQNSALAAAYAELRQLDEIKSQFIAVAAHELRTPLTPLTGYVEVLLDGELGALSHEQREYLQILQASTERLTDLANDLLDISRIQAGRLELTLFPTDLPALVTAISGAYRPRLEEKSQQFTLRLHPDLPLALCDRPRAAQVVRNLLRNAHLYTRTGGEINVSVSPATDPGFLEVAVADNGLGIAPAEGARLFDPFFRGQSAGQAGAGGAGLGLPIARALVEQHGGRIWFESQPAQGSTFHATFPVVDA